jgi:hypothetical protein
MPAVKGSVRHLKILQRFTSYMSFHEIKCMKGPAGFAL